MKIKSENSLSYIINYIVHEGENKKIFNYAKNETPLRPSRLTDIHSLVYTSSVYWAIKCFLLPLSSSSFTHPNIHTKLTFIAKNNKIKYYEEVECWACEIENCCGWDSVKIKALKIDDECFRSSKLSFGINKMLIIVSPHCMFLVAAKSITKSRENMRMRKKIKVKKKKEEEEEEEKFVIQFFALAAVFFSNIFILYNNSITEKEKERTSVVINWM